MLVRYLAGMVRCVTNTAVPVSPAPSRQRNRAGLVALVLGIVAIVCAFIPFLSYVAGFVAIAAIILGIIGIARAAGGPKGSAITGLILGVVALILGIVMSIIYSVLFFAAAAAGGASAAAAPADSTQASAAASSASSASAPASAKPAADWYAKQYPVFASRTYSGTGDSVLTLPAGASKGTLTAKFTGSGNFIVNVLDATNQQTADSGFNKIGNYHGTVGYGLEGVTGSAAHTLKVQADGKWTITAADIASAPALPATGKGDGVFKYSGPSKTAKITHNGQENFIVNEYSDAPISNLEINEIGHYSGTDLVDPGPAVIDIVADGTWTIQ